MMRGFGQNLFDDAARAFPGALIGFQDDFNGQAWPYILPVLTVHGEEVLFYSSNVPAEFTSHYPYASSRAVLKASFPLSDRAAGDCRLLIRVVSFPLVGIPRADCNRLKLGAQASRLQVREIDS